METVGAVQPSELEEIDGHPSFIGARRARDDGEEHSEEDGEHALQRSFFNGQADPIALLHTPRTPVVQVFFGNT